MNNYQFKTRNPECVQQKYKFTYNIHTQKALRGKFDMPHFVLRLSLSLLMHLHTIFMLMVIFPSARLSHLFLSLFLSFVTSTLQTTPNVHDANCTQQTDLTISLILSVTEAFYVQKQLCLVFTLFKFNDPLFLKQT